MPVLIIVFVFSMGWSLLAALFSCVLSAIASLPFTLRIRPLTYLVGVIEVGATSYLVNFYMRQPLSAHDRLTGIVVIIGGWFAIKSLNYPAGPKNESETVKHYRFILGTLFSLAGGTTLGYILSKLSIGLV